MTPLAPVDARPLLAGLHAELVALLRGLSPDDWNKPTVCPGWRVRDIAAHLLDTDLRRLSICRDELPLPPPEPPIHSDADLARFLNRLNADWVHATQRLSPRVLLEIQELVGPQVVEYWLALDPESPAAFGVSWAGETESLAWFDCAREYTERWHHQQQIREAVGTCGLTDRHWLQPVLSTFLRALPVTYRSVDAAANSTVLIVIEGAAGGEWTLRRADEGWILFGGATEAPNATVRTDQDTAWRLFTKGIHPNDAASRVSLSGNAALGAHFLSTLAIVAVR